MRQRRAGSPFIELSLLLTYLYAYFEIGQERFFPDFVGGKSGFVEFGKCPTPSLKETLDAFLVFTVQHC